MEKNNYAKIFDNMVERTKEYLIQNNIKSMVLGLSGGIDSTVSAFVCHTISKKYGIKFIGVSLPSNTNTDGENNIALGLRDLCDEFILKSIENDFSHVSESFDSETFRHGLGNMNPLQLGNIKARIRMMFLYNIASMTNGLCIDTDNRTEHELGFWTIHGDVFDLGFIADLWKSEVYGFAQWLYENYDFDGLENTKEFLKKSIEIIPTDGNGVKAGGDLAQIAPGLTYLEVDAVLRNEVSDTISEQLKEVNRNAFREMYGTDLVNGIIERHHRSVYKRKKMPIAIHVID